MKITLLLVLSILMMDAWGQDSTYLVKAGEHPAKVIPFNVQFKYPEFRKGLLFFPNGDKSPVIPLNYDLLYATMQLINDKGDTLALDESANIVQYVRIESDLYFRDPREGYFLILVKEGPIRLMVRIRLNIVRRETVVDNGYGTSSIGSNSSRSARRSTENGLFLQNDDVYLRKGYDYYFLSGKNEPHKATRQSINRLFPDHKKEIKEYLDENSIDFNKEPDLKKLTVYCNQLK